MRLQAAIPFFMLLLRVNTELRKIFMCECFAERTYGIYWNLIKILHSSMKAAPTYQKLLVFWGGFSFSFLLFFFLQEHFFPNLEKCRQKVDSFNRHHSSLEECFLLFDISVHWRNSQKVMYLIIIWTSMCLTWTMYV